MLWQCAQALKYLKQNQISHGNIQPLTINLNDSLDYIITDIKIFYDKTNEKKRNEPQGDVYRSPERRKQIQQGLFNRNYDRYKADIWSLGRSVYAACNLQKRNPENLHFVEIECRYSTELRQILSKMLENDPDQRISYGEIINKAFSTY